MGAYLILKQQVHMGLEHESPTSARPEERAPHNPCHQHIPQSLVFPKGQ